jgi:hypothetical protein
MHTTLSAKCFGCYKILKIDFAAEFYCWTEQRLNVTQLFGFRLTETPKTPNTITVENSLSFLMAPNCWRFTWYDCRKLDRCAESEIWADHTFRH